MEQLIQRCIAHTVYDTNTRAWKDCSPDIRHFSSKLLADTLSNIISASNVSNSVLQHTIKYINAKLDENSPKNIDIYHELICPLGALYATQKITECAIYDLDGCSFLFARCADSVSELEIEPCIAESSMLYTCCAVNTIALSTLGSIYLPTAEMQKLHDATIKDMKWCMDRDKQIAKTFRSPACCGPSMSAVINRRTTIPFSDTYRPTNTTENRKPPSNIKKAKAPEYKWSGALLSRSFSFLGQDASIEDSTLNDPITKAIFSAVSPVSPKLDENTECALEVTPVEGIPLYGDPRFDTSQHCASNAVVPSKAVVVASTVWTDLVCSATIRDIMREMYPCLCESEFISHLIVGQCNPIITNNQIDTLIETKRYIPPQPRDAIYSLATELMCGTLQSPLSEDLKLFVTTNKKVFRDIAMKIPFMFALRKFFIGDTHYSPLIEPKAIASKTDVLLHQWSLLVEGARQDILATQSNGHYIQKWYITTTTTAPLIKAEDYFRAENMYCRLADMQSASRLCGGASSVIWFDPPNTWPCDVCWTMSLATHGLRMCPQQVGVAIVGPKQRTALVPFGDGHCAICGSMMYLLGAFRRFQSTMQQHHIVAYPFVVLVLSLSNKVSSFLPYGSPLIRAAVAHLSDTCLAHVKANTLIEHDTVIPKFANDMGTVGEEMVIAREALYPHEEVAIESLRKHIWPIFCRGAALIQSGQLTIDVLSVAIVCITRPFRKWTIDPLAESDLWHRTKQHMQHLDRLIAADTSDGEYIETIKRLQIGDTKLDKLIPVVRPRAMHRIFVGSDTKKGCATLQYVTDPYDPVSSPQQDRSLFRLCDDFMTMANDSRKATLAAFAVYRKILLLAERNNIFEQFVSACKDRKLPLVEACCHNKSWILCAPDYMVIADNPMTVSVPPRDGVYKSLLPKNSSLLSEMMHHRYGLPILPNALPPVSVPDTTNALASQYYATVIDNMCVETRPHVLSGDMDTFETNIFLPQPKTK